MSVGLESTTDGHSSKVQQAIALFQKLDPCEQQSQLWLAWFILHKLCKQCTFGAWDMRGGWGGTISILVFGST